VHDLIQKRWRVSDADLREHAEDICTAFQTTMLLFHGSCPFPNELLAAGKQAQSRRRGTWKRYSEDWSQLEGDESEGEPDMDSDDPDVVIHEGEADESEDVSGSGMDE
jgi:hypothetical protein